VFEKSACLIGYFIVLDTLSKLGKRTKINALG